MFVIITGSSGLIGSEAACFFCEKGFDVIGIDNDMRKSFFGEDAGTDCKRGVTQIRHITGQRINCSSETLKKL